MLDKSYAAQMALIAAYAEDMYESLARDHKDTLNPPLDSRISKNWNLVGYLSGQDAVLDTKKMGLGDVVYYGFMVQSKSDPSTYLVAVRGTEKVIEWVKDAEFLPVAHQLAGDAESGFYSIYRSMKYTGPNGQLTDTSAADGIAKNFHGAKLTVVGHSLGSALATYLTLDLAVTKELAPQICTCLFASPRPGDGIFADYFDHHVPMYVVYNYSLDLVPRVPKFFGYTELPRAVELDPRNAEANIEIDIRANHHAVCYAAMLNYQAADWKAMPKIDKKCAACILGPNPTYKAT